MRLIFISAVVLSVALWLTPQTVNAQDNSIAHISDDLTVFIHTGPSRNYRIIGTIIAGSEISVLDRQGDPEFIQMRDAEGRTGWIEAQYISNTGTLRNDVTRLTDENADLSAQLSDAQQRLQRLRSENTTLQQQNSRLATELDASVKRADALQVKVDNADKTEQMEWFTRGGIIAAVCILLGILITYIPKKRRRDDQWM